MIQEYSFFSPSFILTHLICPGFGFVISFVVLSINFFFTLFFRIFEIFIFIHLTASGLSCGTWDLCFDMQCLDSLNCGGSRGLSSCSTWA